MTRRILTVAAVPAVLALVLAASAAGKGAPVAAPAATPALTKPVVVTPLDLVPVASTATSAAAIRSRLTSILSTSTASNRSSAVDIDGLGAVFRQNATTVVPPASTEKLYTTLAALKALGPASRVRTEVRAPYARQGSTQPGDVYLVGAGDAFLTATQLDALANSVRASGITRITGVLVVDESRYDTVRRGPGWKPSYVPEDSGPLSALAVDGNRWRTDSGYLNDPAVPTLDRFRGFLVERGVAVGSTLRRGKAPSTSRVIAGLSSAPLKDRLRWLDKSSNNFASELMLKEIGYRVRGVGSSGHGAAAVRSTMTAMSVGYGAVWDGSGLSSGNRQSGAGEMSLLLAAQRSPDFALPFRQALPVACRDGTLLRRMCNTAAAGRAVGKTGTLPGTYALTGYTFTGDGKGVRYAFLLSGASSGSKARAAIDAAVVYLSGVRIT